MVKSELGIIHYFQDPCAPLYMVVEYEYSIGPHVVTVCPALGRQSVLQVILNPSLSHKNSHTNDFKKNQLRSVVGYINSYRPIIVFF